MSEEDQGPDEQGGKRDERPRPQFGELAPPGWTWQPPKDADRLDTARHSPAASEPDPTVPPPGTEHPGYHPADRFGYGRPDGAPVPPQLRAAAPRWNLAFTIVLLVLGLFGMTYSIGALQALPAAMKLMHSTQHLGAFVPDPSIGSLITGGTIAMAGIWAISLGLSVWLLVRKRLSFYVPLVAGIVALIALFAIVGVVLTTDPVLMDFYSGVGGTTPVTPTPSAPTTST